MTAGQKVLSGIAAVVLVAAAVIGFIYFVFGAQDLGFAVDTRQNVHNNQIANYNNNQANHRFQHSYATLSGDQSALQGDFHSLYSDSSAYGANSAAARGDANSICQVVQNMQNANFGLGSYATWANAHCAFGNLKPGVTP